ncbi:hypothetical protein, partial [Paenibacillus macerans]|uniref:hypothetical protein n=1 Tax=Paenibacillus macerans TaxID=44252 RepID=UPI001C3F5BF1
PLPYPQAFNALPRFLPTIGLRLGWQARVIRLSQTPLQRMAGKSVNHTTNFISIYPTNRLIG